MARLSGHGVLAASLHLKVIVSVLAAVLMSGCTTLASKEVLAGCEVVDMVTTMRALRLSATAYEMNPIPLPVLFLLKIGIVWWVWHIPGWNESPPAPRVVVNAIACAPIPGNLKAARGH